MILALLGACATMQREVDWQEPKQRFDSEIAQLQKRLNIPGIAYSVIKDGDILAQAELSDSDPAPVTVSTPLRFASVSKTFAAVLLMRAHERKLLSLDDPVLDYLPELDIDSSVTLRHLAAHVSEGTPGDEYIYGTNRYGMLGDVLTRVYQATDYSSLLQQELITPLGMRWYDSPFLGAQAGLVSTISDMNKFVIAFQTGKLLSQRSQGQLISPFVLNNGQAGPVAVGWFSQMIDGRRVVWSYGQDDPDHSSALILYLPDSNLSLVMLANTDGLSNPFRLLMGDIGYSAFAASFLQTFVPEVEIPPWKGFLREALMAAWSGDKQSATENVEAAFARSKQEDLVLHFAVSNLLSGDEVMAYDQKIIQSHPQNRWALLMSAGLYERQNQTDMSQQRYEAILALPNQQQDFLWRLFRAWSYGGLARLYQNTDRQRALGFVKAGLETGVRGGTKEELEQLRVKLLRPGVGAED